MFLLACKTTKMVKPPLTVKSVEEKPAISQDRHRSLSGQFSFNEWPLTKEICIGTMLCGFNLTTFNLALDQLGIVASTTQEPLMRSLLHDTHLIQHQDQIRVADGAQAMRNDDLRTGEERESLFYRALGRDIERARCLI